MALHLNLDAGGRVYLTITCDGCSRPFDCYDDACYSFPALRNEAVFAGWQAGTRRDQAHNCPACLDTLPRPPRGRCPAADTPVA